VTLMGMIFREEIGCMTYVIGYGQDVPYGDNSTGT